MQEMAAIVHDQHQPSVRRVAKTLIRTVADAAAADASTGILGRVQIAGCAVVIDTWGCLGLSDLEGQECGIAKVRGFSNTFGRCDAVELWHLANAYVCWAVRRMLESCLVVQRVEMGKRRRVILQH